MRSSARSNRSPRFFWAASCAQVYPALAALEDDGYVLSTDEPHGARPRKTYRLTDKGQVALNDWLISERIPDFEQRDEGLLRVFFADAMAPEEALELVKRLRISAEKTDRDFKTPTLPLAQRATGRFPLIVAREGADYFSWRAAWFQRLESELTAELDSRGTLSERCRPLSAHCDGTGGLRRRKWVGALADEIVAHGVAIRKRENRPIPRIDLPPRRSARPRCPEPARRRRSAATEGARSELG